MNKFILRLVNEKREVLAWSRIDGIARGDGCIWPSQNFVAEVSVPGVAVAVIIHWVDVNVHITNPIDEPMHVRVGEVITVPMVDKPMFRLASEEDALPPVTVTTPVHVNPSPARW